MRTVLAILVLLTTLSAAPLVSQACGFWDLESVGPKGKEKFTRVYARAVEAGNKRFRIELRDGKYEGWIGKTRWATLENSTLSVRGKKRAKIEDNSITIGDAHYKVSFTRPTRQLSVYFAGLSVTRNDKEVFSSEGVMTFFPRCGHPDTPPAEAKKDVLVRLAFVLLRTHKR